MFPDVNREWTTPELGGVKLSSGSEVFEVVSAMSVSRAVSLLLMLTSVLLLVTSEQCTSSCRRGRSRYT